MLGLLNRVRRTVKRRLASVAHNAYRRWADAPRTRNLQLSVEDAQAGAVRVRGIPAALQLQTTRKCNFRCFMCVRFSKGQAGPQQAQDMPAELIRKVADEAFPYIGSIELTTSGEPLLAPTLDETLTLAGSHGVTVYVTTNGSLLGRPGMIERLLPVVGRLSVSLDAATPQTLETIRPGARFDDILSAISRCGRLRWERFEACGKYMYLAIGAVLMRRNVHELPDMVRLAHELRLDEFVASHMVANSPELECESLLHHTELYNNYREQALLLAAQFGQRVVLPPALGNSDSPGAQAGEPPKTCGPRRLQCPFIYRIAYIDNNGDVLPCCRAEMPAMGNLWHDSVARIWNGPQYLHLRQSLRDGIPPRCCEGCYVIAEATKLEVHAFAA